MTENLTCPYLPNLLAEIKTSPIYHRFLRLLREFEIRRIVDTHVHVSSGTEDVVADSPVDLTPQFAFSLHDVNLLYETLFGCEGFDCTFAVFDTPLPAYDLPSKNDQLLAVCRELSADVAGRALPFGVVTPEMTEGQILGWVEGGVRGFKMTPRTSSPFVKRGVISDISLGEMLNPVALTIADRYGLPLIVHLPQLVVSPRIRPSLKEELVEIVGRYPGMKIILAHLGQAQTPAKFADLCEFVVRHGLVDRIWMDISAVTIPSVIRLALESDIRLMFGTDIDFVLTERGRYIMFKVGNGGRVLAEDDDNGNVITALVSTTFGGQLREFALEHGIDLDAPLLLFQYEGIIGAVNALIERGHDRSRLGERLRALFSENAELLLGH